MKILTALGFALVSFFVIGFVSAFTEIAWGWDGDRVRYTLLGSLLAVVFLELLEERDAR